MLVTLLVAFLTSFSTALFLVLTSRWHRHLTSDTPGSGPQKLHDRATPRIGGLAVMVGFALAVVVARVQLTVDTGANAPPWLTGWLVLALFVPFAAGMIEDITKSFGARARLLATFVGAAIAYFFCNATLSRFALPPLDALLALSPVAQFVLTLFCVGAIANAYNLADGLNGLLAGLSVSACAAMGWVAWQHGDQFLTVSTLSLAAAVAGFALFNFPRARLFAGDGGAYLLGTAISLFAILLVHRHADVSPWFAFALVLYPFVDTTAAIVRRLVAGRPIMEPDADHLHTLLAQRLTERLGGSGRNIASAIIVVVSATAAGLAIWLHQQTALLVTLCGLLVAAFAVAYMGVRRTPSQHPGSSPHQLDAKAVDPK